MTSWSAISDVRPIVTLLEAHLDHLDRDRIGFGLDAYHEEAVDHPMAYALYARGLIALACLTGSQGHLDDAGKALATLERLAVEGGRAWGLGFQWHDLDAEQAYVVTTSIAGLAFLDHWEHTGDETSLKIALRAADWVVADLPWRVGKAGAAPWYSRNRRDVLPNVAALAAAFLSRCGASARNDAWSEAARRAREFVVGRQHPLGFWAYGTKPARHGLVSRAEVVDAIHMGYTIDGIAETGGAGTRAAVTRAATFVGQTMVTEQGRCRERLLLAPRQEVDVMSIDAGGGRLLYVDPVESRLWGYGALIGGLARAATAGVSTLDLVQRLLQRLLAQQLASPTLRFAYLPDDRRLFPRHEAHAFEGVSAAALVMAQVR